jgi:hypothetical protein
MEDRREVDLKAAGADAIEKVAADLGLTRAGKHFFCPGCQPTGLGFPDLVIKGGDFKCFRCGAAGDMVGLVKLARRCTLEEAIEWLARETQRQT